jgi:hypothetical protein
MKHSNGEIKAGDRVRPIFSGCRMKVLRLDGNGAVCSWTVGSQEQIAWIDFSCLKRVGPAQSETSALSSGELRLSGSGLFK